MPDINSLPPSPRRPQIPNGQTNHMAPAAPAHVNGDLTSRFSDLGLDTIDSEDEEETDRSPTPTRGTYRMTPNETTRLLPERSAGEIAFLNRAIATARIESYRRDPGLSLMESTSRPNNGPATRADGLRGFALGRSYIDRAQAQLNEAQRALACVRDQKRDRGAELEHLFQDADPHVREIVSAIVSGNTTRAMHRVMNEADLRSALREVGFTSDTLSLLGINTSQSRVWGFPDGNIQR